MDYIRFHLILIAKLILNIKSQVKILMEYKVEQINIQPVEPFIEGKHTRNSQKFALKSLWSNRITYLNKCLTGILERNSP